MKLRSILSRAAHICMDRFPVPAAMATALSVYAIFIILTGQEPDRLTAAISYFLSVGFVLSLSLTLWLEQQPQKEQLPQEEDRSENEEKRDDATSTGKGDIWKPAIIWGGSFLLLLADTLYLYYSNFGHGGRGFETFLMHASAIFALMLTVFFLSFRCERNDIPSWNFALRLITNLIICIAVGLILWGGLDLLYGSMDWLFKVHLSWKWYTITGVLVAGLLPVLLFLGRIPYGEAKHDSEPLHSAFLAGVFRYLFLPLEALYIIVLYIYAFQILLQWELPEGQVSWLVIVSMVGLIAIEFGLYPTRHADNRPFDHAVARLLPLILMPLLLLMTVGIVRRFMDYGITIARLYIATINIWFYAICLVLYLTRARRINWIPISFAALFLLTSALPLNYTSLTRHTLLRQVRNAFIQAGVTELPLNAERYDSLMQNLPIAEQSRISSKLSYLESTFNSKTIESLTTQQEEIIVFSRYIHEDESEDIGDNEQVKYYNGYTELRHVQLLPGYTHLFGNVRCDELAFDAKATSLVVPVGNDDVKDTLLVDIRKFKALDRKMTDLVRIPTKSGKNIYLMQHFYLQYEQTSDGMKAKINLNGFLLTKENQTTDEDK